MKKKISFLSVVFCLILICTSSFAIGADVYRSKGQTVYVGTTFAMWTVDEDTFYSWGKIVIRNLDPDTPIRVKSVTLYGQDVPYPQNQNGPVLVQEFLPEEGVNIVPWTSINYSAHQGTLGVEPYTGEDDKPFFIVEWEADRKVIPPAIGVAIYFARNELGAIIALDIRQGRVIKEN